MNRIAKRSRLLGRLASLLTVLLIIAAACGDATDPSADPGPLDEPTGQNPPETDALVDPDQTSGTSDTDASPTDPSATHPVATDPPATDPPAIDPGLGAQSEPGEKAVDPPPDSTETDPEKVPSEDLEVVPDAVVPEPVPDPVEPGSGAPLAELTGAKVPRALTSMVESAAADLAVRLGVTANEISVAVAQLVVWPDGALGCPTPGMAYTQVQTDGARIVLVHGSSSYSYHAGGSQSKPFYCDHPVLPGSGGGSGVGSSEDV